MLSKKRIVWFVLMIFTMAVIFYFSGQSGDKSNAIGNTVAQTMKIPATNEVIDESHTKLLFGLNLRKWAHVGLFGLLGLATYEWLLSLPGVLIIGFAYSALDEFHQYFVPGREAKTVDVLIDVVSFLLVVLSLHLFGLMRKKC